MDMPRKLRSEDYHFFVERFSNALTKEFPDTCLYVYGSYPEGKFRPGVSDIDGGIILNSCALMPKDKVRRISKLLYDSKNKAPLEIQFNLFDRQTAQDGRFLSYDESYVDWFHKGRAKILSGPDYLKELKRLLPKNGELQSAAMNLRAMRNVLLQAEENKDKHYNQRGSLQYALRDALDKLTSLPKKLVAINGGELENDKSLGEPLLQKVLPMFNSDALIWAVKTRSSQEALHDILFGQTIEGVRASLERVVSSYEGIVQAYIETHLD